jgi:hypothetical protein
MKEWSLVEVDAHTTVAPLCRGPPASAATIRSLQKKMGVFPVDPLAQTADLTSHRV